MSISSQIVRLLIYGLKASVAAIMICDCESNPASFSFIKWTELHADISVDYWLTNGNVFISHLYSGDKSNKHYYYHKGWNIQALVAYICGVAVPFPGSCHFPSHFTSFFQGMLTKA